MLGDTRKKNCLDRTYVKEVNITAKLSALHPMNMLQTLFQLSKKLLYISGKILMKPLILLKYESSMHNIRHLNQSHLNKMKKAH